MKSECNRCGECCRVIHIGHTKKTLRTIKNPDVKFILKHWCRISRKEAYKRQPTLKARDWNGFYFYACDAWDEKTHLCKMYESRPEVCRGFPFYGEKSSEAKNDFGWLKIMGCEYVKESK